MPRVVKFTADWCAPCHTLADVMKGLEYESIDVETDEGREKMFDAGTRTLPTLVFLDDDGEEMERIVGLKPRKVIIETYERNGIATT